MLVKELLRGKSESVGLAMAITMQTEGTRDATEKKACDVPLTHVTCM